jgi:hypothetical protein
MLRPKIAGGEAGVSGSNMKIVASDITALLLPLFFFLARDRITESDEGVVTSLRFLCTPRLGRQCRS